jgi:plastocyanin
MSRLFQVLSLLAALAAAACGGSSPSGSAAPKTPEGAPAGKRVDASKAGSIAGRVVFEGTPPAAAELQITDSKCAASGRRPRDESVVVDDGGLKNVFVYVKDGLSGYSFDVPSDPVELDQDGCVYAPRVIGLRVGQPLNVLNSDSTAHNVHAAAKINQQVNTAQPFKGMVYTHAFSTREIMVPFRCDIHPWMIAYVGVVDHPYFAVTGDGGRFELKDLPAGTYTIEAWHEKLGARTATVTVGEKETKDIAFTFKAS